MQLHETGFGKRFFDNQLPRLIKALERIADALEEANKPILKEEKKNDSVR